MLLFASKENRILAGSFLVSFAVHGLLFLALSAMSFKISIDETQLVEVELSPDLSVPILPDKPDKENVSETPSTGKDVLIPTKEKVPDVNQQQIPVAAKGDKLGDKNNIKDKGPVGNEFSNQGSPKGAEEGYTWGGDNMTLVKTITPQNRIDKTKSWSVKGEAEIKAVPDKSFVQMAIEARDPLVKSAMDKIDQKIKYLRRAIASTPSYQTTKVRSSTDITVEKWGTPRIEQVIIAYKKESVTSPVGSRQEFMQGGEIFFDNSTAEYYKKVPIYEYLITSNITMDVSSRFSYSEELIEVISIATKNGANLITNKIIPTRVSSAAESGGLLGPHANLGTSDTDKKTIADDRGTNYNLSQDNVISYGFKDATKEKLKKQVVEMAVENAKKKAALMAKQLGISIKDITPLIDEDVSFGRELDESRQITITGRVTLYF